MKKLLPYLLPVWVIFYIAGCQQKSVSYTKSSATDDAYKNYKNIIIIVVDDFGYEIPECNGGESYSTPNIDALASNGTRFTNFRTCPNCSPSRVSLLTGKYNFKNYTAWGVMDWNNITIANKLKDAGYSCAAFGKWQFDGGDAAIKHFGFDTYNVDNPYKVSKDEDFGSRYKNPIMYKNGQDTSYNQGEYLDDIITEDAINFMDSVSKQFFIYLAYSNTHTPFSPTPSDAEYSTWDENTEHQNARRFFPSMVNYIDDLVKKVIKNIPSETVVLFMGDNGTSPNISSVFNGNLVNGGKGETNEFGIHAPLIVYGLGAGVDSNFIDLPDIYSTMLEVADIKNDSEDGVSFYNSLTGLTQKNKRDYSYCYWSPKTTLSSTKIKEWVLGKEYKVYANGEMFNYKQDPYEQNKISDNIITAEQQNIKERYLSIIQGKH